MKRYITIIYAILFFVQTTFGITSKNILHEQPTSLHISKATHVPTRGFNPLNNQPITMVAWHSSGKYFAAGGIKTPLQVYQFDQEEKEFFLLATSTSCTSISHISWSACGNYLVTSTSDDGPHMYHFNEHDKHLRTQKLCKILVHDHHHTHHDHKEIECCSWSPGGHYYAVSTSTDHSTTESVLYFYEVSHDGASATLLATHHQEHMHGHILFCAWSPDSKQVAFATECVVYIYTLDQETKQVYENPLIIEVTQPKQPPYISDIAWHPKKNMLTVSAGPTIHLYAYDQGKSRSPVKTSIPCGENIYIKTISWSNNGSLLYVGSWKDDHLYEFTETLERPKLIWINKKEANHSTLHASWHPHDSEIVLAHSYQGLACHTLAEELKQ